MSVHTRVSTALWDWDRFTTCTLEGRIVYLALYTSRLTKRAVPGLLQGDLQDVAEAAHTTGDVALAGINHLIERELVEMDRQARVIRLTILPPNPSGEEDHRHAEGAMNSKHLRGWWPRFCAVPQCGVRDVHVTLLWQISQPFSAALQRTWDETFGTLASAVQHATRHRKAVLEAKPRQQNLLLTPPPKPMPAGLAAGLPEDLADTISGAWRAFETKPLLSLVPMPDGPAHPRSGRRSP